MRLGLRSRPLSVGCGPPTSSVTAVVEAGGHTEIMTLFGRMHRSISHTPPLKLWMAAGLGAMGLLLARASLWLER